MAAPKCCVDQIMTLNQAKLDPAALNTKDDHRISASSRRCVICSGEWLDTTSILSHADTGRVSVQKHVCKI